MPVETTQQVSTIGVSLNDAYMIGGIVSSVTIASVAITAWVHRQLQSIKTELHMRISKNKDDVAIMNSDIKLLNQAQDYHKIEMEKITNTLDNVYSEVGDVRKSLIDLSKTQGEQHMALIGTMNVLTSQINSVIAKTESMSR